MNFGNELMPNASSAVKKKLKHDRERLHVLIVSLLMLSNRSDRKDSMLVVRRKEAGGESRRGGDGYCPTVHLDQIVIFQVRRRSCYRKRANERTTAPRGFRKLGPICYASEPHIFTRLTSDARTACLLTQ